MAGVQVEGDAIEHANAFEADRQIPDFQQWSLIVLIHFFSGPFELPISAWTSVSRFDCSCFSNVPLV